MKSVVAALLVCVAVPALAQVPATDKPCLQQVSMYSFDPVAGNKSLIVTDLQHRRYRVNFMGPCNNLQFHMGVRFKTFGTSNLSCVSRGDQVIVRDVAGPPVCVVQSVEYQTPALDKADADAAAARRKP